MRNFALFLLSVALGASSCVSSGAQAPGSAGTPPQDTSRSNFLIKPVASLGEINDPSDRRVVEVATKNDVTAGVLFSDLVKMRVSIDGNVLGEGFAYDIVVSDHPGMLSALPPDARVAYQGFLEKVGLNSQAQATPSTPRVRVLYGWQHGDPSPKKMRIMDAAVLPPASMVREGYTR